MAHITYHPIKTSYSPTRIYSITDGEWREVEATASGSTYSISFPVVNATDARIAELETNVQELLDKNKKLEMTMEELRSEQEKLKMQLASLQTPPPPSRSIENVLDSAVARAKGIGRPPVLLLCDDPTYIP